MRAVAVALALAASPLAGCLADETVAPAGLDLGSLDPARVLPYLDLSDAHDHADVARHDAGWNLEVLGWTPYTEDGTLGRHNQVQVHGDLAFVSVYALPPSMKPGLVVVDVSDPAAPRPVGSFASDFTTTIDVHLSEDGRYAALAGHRIPTGAPTPEGLGCTTVPAPVRPLTLCPPFAPAGIQLLDVSDPTTPRLVGEWNDAPSGAHTVKLRTIDGELYAFIASYGVYYVDRVASGVHIVKHDPSVPRGFVPVSVFLPSEPSGRSVFAHDLWIQEHPVTEQRLLYVAYWDGGVVVVDIDDPAEPREVAVWKDFDGATYGNVHFVQPMPALVDGRHYTVAAPEYITADHAGETYVLDTTDPTAPRLVTRWSIPGDPVNPTQYMHSPHNFDLTPEGLMVMGHYHAGVWVLDLRPVFAADAAGEVAEPTVLGYRFTVPPAGSAFTLAEKGWATNVWNAVWTSDGRIVVSDIDSGLYVLDLAVDDTGAPPYVGLV